VGPSPDELNAAKRISDNRPIGGTTNWDTNRAAFLAIMAEWDRTDLRFADRRSDLLSGTNRRSKKRLNQVNGELILLTPATNRTSSNGTVHADASRDVLLGGLGHNWFFYDADDTLNPRRGDKTDKVR
jgi:hypothetical protein